MLNRRFKLEGKMRRGCAVIATIAAFAASGAPLAVRAAPERTEADAMFARANELVNSDPQQARRLMAAAADSGDPEMLNAYAVYLQAGIGGERDRAAAKRLMERAAASGSVAAKVNLGSDLMTSEAPADQQRGYQLLQEAYKTPAARGQAAAGLAEAHLFGRGAPKDMDAGVALLEETHKSGHTSGQVEYLLGRTYQAGWADRSKDPARSLGHFRRACDLGAGRGCWFAGMALLRGEGVGKDAAAAYGLVRTGAELGDHDSMISTAVMLATAEGVTADAAEARKWYAKAAETHNSAHALRGLGMMLIVGEGGASEPVRGYGYLTLAAEGGDAAAVQLLKSLGNPRKDVLNQAETIRSEWVAAHGKPSSRN